MRFVNRLFLVFAAMTAFAVSSCVESNDLSFEEVEKLALDTMFDEFGDGGSASIMISDIDMKDVSAIRKEMSKVKGVRRYCMEFR